MKRNNADTNAIENAKKDYYIIRKKYIAKVDEILDAKTDNIVDLSKSENLNIIYETLTFWEGKRIGNYCFCVMPNHVHWVLRVFEKDTKEKPVYLEEIMHSVKLFSARQINIFENRKGTLWNKESFDTTIRDRIHLYRAIEYTLNNPIKANLVKNREDWKGNFNFERD